MGITLIVTRYYDREFNKTGQFIESSEWAAFVESDSCISWRTEPFTATAPDGEVFYAGRKDGKRMVQFTRPDGQQIPFLDISRRGELSMKYAQDLENPLHPIRQKIVEIAKHFGALITSDAGDEFLNW